MSFSQHPSVLHYELSYSHNCAILPHSHSRKLCLVYCLLLVSTRVFPNLMAFLSFAIQVTTQPLVMIWWIHTTCCSAAVTGSLPMRCWAIERTYSIPPSLGCQRSLIRGIIDLQLKFLASFNCCTTSTKGFCWRPWGSKHIGGSPISRNYSRRRWPHLSLPLSPSN